MKFRRVQSYKLRRLFPMLGIAGIATLGTVGCEKEDDLKSALRTEQTPKHDTVYVNKTDTLRPDTVYIPADTLFIPGDTIYLPGDTIYLPGDTIFTPCDTLYIPGDTVFAKPDTIYVKPDTVYTPSKPDTIYTPSKPDTVYVPSKPDTIYLKPDTVYIEKPETPHHNTTYIWGDNNWNAIWPEITDNVAKSADSTIVDKVILKNDGRSLGGTRTSSLMNALNIVIESVSPENRYKVRGSGTLETTGIANQQDVQDSIRLSTLGFSFGKVVYDDSFQR